MFVQKESNLIFILLRADIDMDMNMNKMTRYNHKPNIENGHIQYLQIHMQTNQNQESNVQRLYFSSVNNWESVIMSKGDI